MSLDQHGNPTTGATAAVDFLDAAVDHLVNFRPAVTDAVVDAIAADPTAPMPRVMAAYLGLLGTEPADAATAATEFGSWRRAVDDTPWTGREHQHVVAAQRWLGGDLAGAADDLRTLSVGHPRDLLALFVGHQLDFFRGDAVALRDRIGGALSSWPDADPHRGYLLGMAAFGLEECGQYDRAEALGLQAVADNPGDVWGIHAVVHTYEMRGDVPTGLAYLDQRRTDWATGNFLHVHTAWHEALYRLDSGDPAGALAIYDSVLHTASSEGLVMELLDAAGLLWRRYLDGDEQTARWRILADAWDPKLVAPHYAFNDAFGVMALLGAGRVADAEALVEARRRWLAQADPRLTNVTMTGEVGLPVCDALIAYATGRFGDAVAQLAPIRNRLADFGGSHAQRDAFQRTLVAAALAAEESDLARTLLSERLTTKPRDGWTWRRYAELQRLTGHRDPARDRTDQR
ncbi:MAG: tetratricopeptide repeat protein [Actinomycetota bacterium]|nr:MAG: tetratricopeptide repeat protein [Actinomycetota bacterium]